MARHEDIGMLENGRGPREGRVFRMAGGYGMWGEGIEERYILFDGKDLEVDALRPACE